MGTWLGAYFGRGSLASENARLKTALAAAQMELESLRREHESDQRLRTSLELGARVFQVRHWICAPVLSRGGLQGLPSVVRLGKGTSDNVRVGAAVAVPEGLVGRVTRVSEHTCEVRLVTDPAVRVSCEVEGADAAWGRVIGVVEGGGGETLRGHGPLTMFYVFNPLRVCHLGRRPTLPPHARVVTSGLGGVFPRGLLVGHLMDGLDEDEQSLEREGRVVPALDFAALENVFIRRED